MQDLFPDVYAFRGPIGYVLGPGTSEVMRECKFNPGILQITKGVVHFKLDYDFSLVALLKRHLSGDWGEFALLSTEDAADCRRDNDAAAKEPRGSIYSDFSTPHGRIMIVTYVGAETTILLPEEW